MIRIPIIVPVIKDLFSINIKSRHDSISDQFNRIFLVKLFLVCSLVTGISWYTDSFNCILPGFLDFNNDVDKNFVKEVCWIRGFYVYKQLQTRLDKTAYFGIPKDVDMDGMMTDGTLCTTQYQFEREPNPDCKPMEKTFYLQYQWMPFLIAALSLMFYMPYMVFILFNNDLVTLRKQVKSDEPDAEKIVKRYFKSKRKSLITTLTRLLMNMSVKILYLVANVVAFAGLDNILNKEFRVYGKSWIDWSKTNNTIQYDYMDRRDFPKPGNLLLPPFGYCEVSELAQDIKVKVGNQHKFICEISQHVLYQYCLMVLWFALIAGVVISVIGILVLLVRYILGVCRIRKITGLDRKLYDSLTFRQLEYLEFMKKKKMELYGEVMSLLHRQLAAGNTASGGVKL